MIKPHFHTIRHALLLIEVNNYITVTLEHAVKVSHAASIDLTTTTQINFGCKFLISLLSVVSSASASNSLFLRTESQQDCEVQELVSLSSHTSDRPEKIQTR